jgi:hypothetical protein
MVYFDLTIGMDSDSDDLTFNTGIYYQYQPHIQ